MSLSKASADNSFVNTRWSTSRQKYRKEYHIPRGILRLHIEAWGTGNLKKRWQDSNKKAVEDSLNEFIINIVKAADINRADTIKRKEHHQRWLDESKRREEIERQRRLEEEQLRDLENQAEKVMPDPLPQSLTLC